MNEAPSFFSRIPMNVPLLDLKAQYRTLKPDLDAAILKVVESQYFILGPEVKAFEENISKYLGCNHAIGVSSGTDALLLALMALGIGPGDGVITPTYSFFATAGVVSRLNATPIFADIELETYNIDPANAEQALLRARKEGTRVKAIIPVHLYGQSADMRGILDLAEKYDLKVVEDAAQAIGVQDGNGRHVGTIGHVGCFSFFPSKNLGGYGDAGLITTEDDTLAHLIEIMRVHGGEPKYYHKVIGGNFRIDAIQAAVLNVKLPHLNDWSRARRRNAALYNFLFIDSGLAEGTGREHFDEQNRILLPASVYEASGHEFVHIYNQYCIRVQDRDGLIAHLRANNIGCEIYYPVPFHRQECFADVPIFLESFPNADAAAATILALPVYPELTEEMIRFVVDNVVGFVRGG